MRTIAAAGLLFLLFFGPDLFAQDFKPSKTQFMIRGYGHSGLNYEKVNDEDPDVSFVGATFAPIFLFKHSDRLLFEAELEFELEDGEVKVGFEYANFNYVLNKYITARAGKFLLPFGTFMERLHPAWINRLSTLPLGFGHDGVAPSSGIGVELRGSAPIGSGKINYSLYMINGPVLVTSAMDPEEAGMLRFENFEDNNGNKAVGGRLGILPLSNSSVELGVSFYNGLAGNSGSEYENVAASLYALDFSYVKQISAIKGTLDIKAQYTQSNVSDANYYEMAPGDTIPVSYTFANTSNAYFAQLSYRPSMASGFIKNVEIVGRYSTYTTPEGAEWELEASQFAIGLNYWLSWRSVLKFSYQITESVGGHGSTGANTTRGMFAHWALGF